MLPEAIAVLAGAGGTAIVQAMVSDGWRSTKSRLVQLLGRGDPERASAVEKRLESSRAELMSVSSHGLEKARQAQVTIWQGRLSELLNEHPQVETELRTWLQQVQTSQPGVLTLHAWGRSQAALGSGVQINEFIGPSEPDDIVATIAVPTGRRYGSPPLRGRDELIAELLDGQAGPGTRILHGLGGSGKSSVALEVAYRAQDSGVRVWWVPATDPERVTMGMLALARRLGLSDEQIGHRDVADLVWQRLAARGDPWLLVFDNADDPDVLAIDDIPLSDGTGWLRPVQTTAGMVIVTSRQGEPQYWGGWCHLHNVGMLSPAEGAQVLIDNVGDTAGDSRSAESLAERLGGLPLALRLAASYLAQAQQTPAVFVDTDAVRTFDQYKAAVDDRFDEVFPSQRSISVLDQQARQMIGRTWELSLAFLDRRGVVEARPLLRLLACMADAPVPYELLLRPAMLSKAAPFSSSITGTRVWGALQALASTGLIELPEGTRDHVPVLRLHPLVRDTSRLDGHHREYFPAAVALLLAVVRSTEIGPPEQPARWPIWQTLVPHTLAVLDALKSLTGIEEEAWKDTAHAAYMIARHLAATGAYRQADAVYRQVHSIRVRVLGVDHRDTLNAYYGIARMAAARGNYDDAEVAYRDVLSSREGVLGAHHPDTLNARYGLARVAAAQGRYSHAEAAYREILTVEEQLRGADHPDTLRARYGIARMLGDQGRYEEAEAMYRALLVMQERSPEGLAAGEQEESKTVYREVLAVEERIVGTDRPDRLTTRYAIAWVAAAQGRFDVAESAYREVLAVEERDLGPDHPDTLTTRHKIARMTAGRGDHQAAEDIFREVLTDRRKVLGPEHPNTLSTGHWLAHAIKAQGRHREAADAFQKVLDARQNALGHDHPETRKTRRELAALQSHPDDSGRC